MARNYYIGPWRWVDDPEMGEYWDAPPGTVGRIDLRPFAACAQAGGTHPQNYGLFVTEKPLLDAKYTLLATDLDAALKPDILTAVQAKLKTAALKAKTVRELLVELLTTHADPDQIDRVACVVPKQNGMMEIWLCNERIWQRPFSGETDSAWPNIQKVVQKVYRETRAWALAEAAIIRSFTMEPPEEPYPAPPGAMYEALRQRMIADAKGEAEAFNALVEAAAQQAESLHRKRLTDWQGKLGIRDSTKFIPDDLPQDELPAPKETSYTDDFNRSNEELGDSANWTEVAGDWEVISNEVGIGASGHYQARFEQDLSSDDHYAQIDITTWGGSSGTGAHIDPVARFAAALWTGYSAITRRSDNEINVYKIVSGSYTTLTATGITFSLPDTIKIEADGSSIKSYFNGVEKSDDTDATITGNTRTGLWGNGHGDVSLGDNFEAADLGGGTTTTAAPTTTSSSSSSTSSSPTTSSTSSSTSSTPSTSSSTSSSPSTSSTSSSTSSTPTTPECSTSSSSTSTSSSSSSTSSTPTTEPPPSSCEIFVTTVIVYGPKVEVTI